MLTPVRAGWGPVPRPARHVGAALLLVLAVCAALGAWSFLSYRDGANHLRALTARADGRIVAVGDGSVRVTWPGGTASVAVAGTAPPVGTRTQVAYRPGDRADAIVPGAALLADVDADRDGVLFPVLVAGLALLATAWSAAVSWASARRPGVEAEVRRVVLRRGLVARSWLETAGPARRWLPVHFEAALVTLPAPATVLVHGDPGRHRRVAVTLADGTVLYPSGRVGAVEPRGRRTDSPTRPDAHAAVRAARAATPRGQLRVDAALLVPAPLVGVAWAYLDGGGVAAWAGATAVSGALALWWAALRGADPS